MNESKRYKYISVVFCLFALSAMVLSLFGCSSPGETPDEVSRRRKRVIRNDLLQVQDDLDAVLMLDKPSRISDKPIR